MRLSGERELTGSQFKEFTDALVDAFPGEGPLDRLLQFCCNKQRAAIALGTNLQDIVFRIISTAEAEGWTAELLAGARTANPGNDKLLRFSEQFGLAPTSAASGESLEEVISRNGIQSAPDWRSRFGVLETKICKIEIGGNDRGTGFLVGPDVLITNHHVMKPVIAGERHPSEVVMRFDFKRLATGPSPNAGREYQLVEHDWLIDSSEPSPLDELPPAPQSDGPDADKLDYALLRVAGAPGHALLGPPGDSGAPSRGWVEVPRVVRSSEPDDILLILQHPYGWPLSLAIGRVINVNGNRTRLTYTVDTEGGASGSPCFGDDLQLVALHHSRDPSETPTYNQGVPFAAIVQLLTQRGLAGLLHSTPL